MSPDNRHKFALPYWARPGIATFAQHDDGGGNDEPEDDDDPEDDEPEDDEDPDEGKSEDELRAELKKVRESLGKANGQSAKRRQRERDLKAQLEASKKPKPKSDGDDDKPDLDAIREEAKAEARAEALAIRKLDKAELALARAGVSPAKLAKAVKLLDADYLDLNDDGTLDGIDDQLDDLKAEWPELFAGERGTRKRRRVGGDDDRDGSQARGGAKTATERQAASVTRGR
jgi:hypothetical protein